MRELDPDPTPEDEETPPGPAVGVMAVDLPAEAAGGRLDKALAEAAPGLSRARIQALIAQGQVSLAGRVLTSGSAKAEAGRHEIIVPAPVAAEPEPQAIPLTVLYEDAYLIVVDKALAEAAPGLSRARIQALIAQGQVSLAGRVLASGSAKAEAGRYEIVVPAPVAAEPAPEAIPLTVLHEDAYLIVVDKPPGMAVHPAPGSETGTLVNALLAHCGASLSGIGGVARPGIVHRIDKETSGIVVAAKTDAAHQGLSALFAAHDIDRVYVALTRGAPAPAKGTIATRIGRSPHDRKKMAVLKTGGREAITHYAVARTFGPADKPLAARVSCTLETGRTHQIRVHLASKGAPCLGDPVYRAGAPAAPVKAAIADAGLTRQALHAAVLGFVHPVTGEHLRFESPLPPDMAALEADLASL